MSASRRRGFTLVELLVVVGIIAGLIAILLPVLSKARDHANRIKCEGNLHSIGHALMQYTQQYGWYPCTEVIRGSRGDYALWPARLKPILGGERHVFQCPSQDERCEWNYTISSPPSWRAQDEEAAFGYEPGEPVISVLGSFFSYAYNMWGAGGPSTRTTQLGLGGIVNARVGPSNDPYSGELRASRVKVASQMIAIADATADGLVDFAMSPDPEPHQTRPGAVHRRGANVLFCDGHVDWYLQQDLLMPASNHPRFVLVQRMWNNDHEPHW